MAGGVIKTFSKFILFFIFSKYSKVSDYYLSKIHFRIL